MIGYTVIDVDTMTGAQLRDVVSETISHLPRRQQQQ